MNYKRTLLALCAVAALSTAAAQSNYLHIKTASGWEVVDIDKIDKLTFKDGVMTATGSDNSVVASIKQQDLHEMYVNETSGVANVAGEESKAAFSFDSESRSVRMLADGDFRIYDASGRLLVAIPEVKRGETVSLAGINPGIVIIKSGEFTFKALLK